MCAAALGVPNGMVFRLVHTKQRLLQATHPVAPGGRCRQCSVLHQQHRQPALACAALPGPLVAVGDAASAALSEVLPLKGPWGVWTALVLAGTIGVWSERHTRIGKELSGAMVTVLLGMALANLGILPPHPAELKVVYKYLLPLAIPLMLLSANLLRMLRETGELLLAFLLGAAATVVGSALAVAIFPLAPHLGDAGWRIASALTARHVGGAVNYMAVCDVLEIPPSIFGAGLAADDLILTIYFTTIYALARAIPASQLAGPAGPPATPLSATAGQAAQPPTALQAPAAAAGGGHGGAAPPKQIQVMEGLIALSISTLVCCAASGIATRLGAPGQTLTLTTGLTVALATLAPRPLAAVVPSAEGLAQILMAVFYATIGASADVLLVFRTAPVLFAYSFIAIAVHLAIVLGVGRLLGFSRQSLLIASNANIGGMASTMGWTSLVAPGIMTSTLGYSLGTFLGLGLGHACLRHLP